MSELKKISNDTELKPGDRLAVDITRRFSLGGTLDAYLLAGKVYQLEKDHPEFTIEKWDNLDTGIRVYVRVNEITEPQKVQAGVVTPAVIIAAIVGVSIIFLSVTTYQVIDRAADTIENPEAAEAIETISKTVTNGSVILAVAAVVGLWIYFTKGKK
ncbi:MAG: hypothetical protein ABFD91_18985 [Anaerohalosphaeraceae bacterium]